MDRSDRRLADEISAKAHPDHFVYAVIEFIHGARQLYALRRTESPGPNRFFRARRVDAEGLPFGTDVHIRMQTVATVAVFAPDALASAQQHQSFA